MGKAKPVRAYDSPLREQRAVETRTRILEAAALLFTRDGYAATTLAKIAAEADIAAPTVYAVLQSKRGIVEALVAELKHRTEVGVKFKRIMESESAAEMLALSASITRAYSEAGGPLITAIEAAASADREVGAIWIEAENSRRRGQALLAKRIEVMGGLRKGLDAKEAGDLLWALSSHGVYLSLVNRCGWSPDRFETWLLDATAKMLLGKSANAR